MVDADRDLLRLWFETRIGFIALFPRSALLGASSRNRCSTAWRCIITIVTDRLFTTDQRLDFLAGQRFILKQPFSNRDKALLFLGQDFARFNIGLIDQTTNFAVDGLRGGFRNILLLRYRMSQKDFLLVFTMSDDAPEVMFSLPKVSSSATRPPIMIASRDTIHL